MLLVTSNAQSELTAIERGIHALRAIEKSNRGGLAITAAFSGWPG